MKKVRETAGKVVKGALAVGLAGTVAFGGVAEVQANADTTHLNQNKEDVFNDEEFSIVDYTEKYDEKYYKEIHEGSFYTLSGLSQYRLKLYLEGAIGSGVYHNLGGATTRGDVVEMIKGFEDSLFVQGQAEHFGTKKNLQEAIRLSKSMGIVNGYSNGQFGENDKVTREQMATILVRYFKLEPKGEAVIKDVPKTKWSYDGVNTLVTNNISILGADGKYNPTANIKNSDFIRMIVRLMDEPVNKNHIKDLKQWQNQMISVEDIYVNLGYRDLEDLTIGQYLTIMRTNNQVKAHLKELEANGFDTKHFFTKHEVGYLVQDILEFNYRGRVSSGYYYSTKGIKFYDPMNLKEDKDYIVLQVRDNVMVGQAFDKLVRHEMGHHVGYQTIHYAGDFSKFNELLVRTQGGLKYKQQPRFWNVPNNMKGDWGERFDEQFAERYVEMFYRGHENRTILQSFQTETERQHYMSEIRNYYNN